VVAVLLIGTRTGLRGSAADAAGDLVRADVLACLLLASLAFSLATGRGAVPIFRNRAEARFIVGSALRAPLAIAYLQTREVTVGTLRFFVSFFYLLLAFGPRRLGPQAMVTDIALFVAVVGASVAMNAPRRLLAPPAGFVAAVGGGLGALLALVPLIGDGLPLVALPAPVEHALRTVVPAWHPGAILLAPTIGWVLAAVALDVAAIAILAAAGRDRYPELYALSVARLDRAERQRGWRASPVGAGVRSRSGLEPPAGAGVLVWKSVVEFGRTRPWRRTAGGALLWCGAGFVLGRFAGGESSALFLSSAATAINILLVSGSGELVALGDEVRRPLFWVSGAGLFARLSALLIARTWRMSLTLECVAAGFALGGGTAFEVFVVAVGFPVLVVLFESVAFATFAAFPSAVDRRGLAVGLRLGGSIVVVAPPLTLAAIGISLTGVPLAGVLGAIALGLIEAGFLISFAAWRLDGRIDRAL
jgi:hypothetical protein